MDRKVKTIYILISVCLLLAAALGLTLLKDCRHEGTGPPGVTTEKEVKLEVKYDTASVTAPEPKGGETLLRTETRSLPAADKRRERPKGGETASGHGGEEQGAGRDSVEVEIPITQKEYGDSTYHAWVSGYMANLDSIRVYTRKEYRTETVRLRERRRWGFTIGPTVGAGWNGQKIAPYIGLGVTWGYSF